MAQLLPFILPGLRDKSHANYQLATYMLFMRLITRCSPTPQLFNGAWQITLGHEKTGLHVCSEMSSATRNKKVLMMRSSLLEVHPVTSKQQFVFPEAPARHHIC